MGKGVRINITLKQWESRQEKYNLIDLRYPVHFFPADALWNTNLLTFNVTDTHFIF